MRIITFGGAVSLDGFLGGPDGALDWLHFSADVQQITGDYWKTIDTILMGRKTYIAALAQRPQENENRKTKKETRTPKNEKRTTNRKPAMRTYVFSRTLTTVDDDGVELVTTDAAAFVRALKEQPGKDICLMGGGELAQTLIGAGLVDKVGLNVHPVLLGQGIPVFRDPGRRVALELTECRRLDGGCVLITYEVRKIGG
jgi:dihydrofolate reductase